MNRIEETRRLGGSATLWLPAVVGILAVVPLAFLELVDRRRPNDAFPFVLFVLLWVVLPAVLFWLTISAFQVFRSDRAQASGYLILRVIVLGVIARFWSAILTDQMPCFVGVPNCD
jgi:hypothetical protein